LKEKEMFKQMKIIMLKTLFVKTIKRLKMFQLKLKAFKKTQLKLKAFKKTFLNSKSFLMKKILLKVFENSKKENGTVAVFLPM